MLNKMGKEHDQLNISCDSRAKIQSEIMGGRTKTSIIATISPHHKDLKETLSTLNFAQRAKNIQNKPEINHLLKTVPQQYTKELRQKHKMISYF
jgi:kinesin family member 11